MSTLVAVNGHAVPKPAAPVRWKEFYNEHGYVIVNDALSPLEVEELREETTRLCRG
jgi:hypothetical protein